LHFALLRESEEVARLLLDHGADATVQDIYRATPLRLSSQGGHREVIRHLVEHGALDERGTNSRQVALHQGDVNLPRVVERGADTTT